MFLVVKKFGSELIKLDLKKSNDDTLFHSEAFGNPYGDEYVYKEELNFNGWSTYYDWLITDEYLCIKTLSACSDANKMAGLSFWKNDFAELYPIGGSPNAVDFTTAA